MSRSTPNNEKQECQGTRKNVASNKLGSVQMCKKNLLKGVSSDSKMDIDGIVIPEVSVKMEFEDFSSRTPIKRKTQDELEADTPKKKSRILKSEGGRKKTPLRDVLNSSNRKRYLKEKRDKIAGKKKGSKNV